LIKKRNREDFWSEFDALVSISRNIFACILFFTVVAMVVPIRYSTLTSYVIEKTLESFIPPDVEVMPLGWEVPAVAYLLVSFVIGILASIPYILFQIWKYLKPILPKGMNFMKIVALLFALLFLGAVYGWFFIVPMNIRALLFFNRILGLPAKFSFEGFITLVFLTETFVALFFTLPLWIYLLVKADIIKSDFIAGRRRLLYGILIIAVCLLDPDPYLFTEAFLVLPLIIGLEIVGWYVR